MNKILEKLSNISKKLFMRVYPVQDLTGRRGIGNRSHYLNRQSRGY